MAEASLTGVPCASAGSGNLIVIKRIRLVMIGLADIHPAADLSVLLILTTSIDKSRDLRFIASSRLRRRNIMVSVTNLTRGD